MVIAEVPSAEHPPCEIAPYTKAMAAIQRIECLLENNDYAHIAPCDGDEAEAVYAFIATLEGECEWLRNKLDAANRIITKRQELLNDPAFVRVPRAVLEADEKDMLRSCSWRSLARKYLREYGGSK
jgi:hypothetical protein